MEHKITNSSVPVWDVQFAAFYKIQQRLVYSKGAGQMKVSLQIKPIKLSKPRPSL